MKYIFIGKCSIYSMTVEVYLLQPMAILGGQKNGFPTTGLLAVNDGHYKAPTMGIVSTL